MNRSYQIIADCRVIEVEPLHKKLSMNELEVLERESILNCLIYEITFLLFLLFK